MLSHLETITRPLVFVLLYFDVKYLELFQYLSFTASEWV